MTGDTQIKSIFERWERLEGEKKAISDDLKELFSEAKHAGYDGKALRAAFNRKVKQDNETTADQQFDMVVDTYLDAINGVARDARVRARENIEEFDPITGEIKEDIDPKLAHTIVTGMQTDIGRKTLIAAVDIMIAREEAAEDRNDDANGVGSAVADGSLSVTAGETALNSEKATVTAQGEVTASTSAERVTPHGSGSADANAGGDHVTAPENAATHQADGLVRHIPSATKPLKPLCKRPENCGGYGSVHCGSCMRAAREEQAA